MKKFLRTGITAIFAALLCLPQPLWAAGAYLVGDFHNHTAFSDGATSIDRLIDESIGTYELDWFVQSGHGGAFSRDGRLDDWARDCNADGQGDALENTVGLDNFKGDPAGTGYCDAANMWRWQSLQDYAYPTTNQKALEYDQPIIQGFEYQVPGHEHCSVSVIDGQFEAGNADAMAQFEYLFDYRDNDTSEGQGQGWTGKIPNIENSTDAGFAMHAKAVESVKWLQDNYPGSSYVVWAHIERRGAWDKDRAYSTGYNVEHFRDFNNAGPDVAFGWEGEPGHQASGNRGGFGSGAFGGTYGGVGYYSATIGNMWDALLGEGRNWWFFGSSDWHNRGSYLPTDEKTTNDFWPGEFQKDYVYIENSENPTAFDIIDGLSSGNSYVVMGDLIQELEFTVAANGNTATMGQKLFINPGDDVTVKIRVHDPQGTNHCPYSFDNPSLAQIGIIQPLNQPVLNRIDLVKGDVTGRKGPYDQMYTDPTNPSAAVVHTFNADNWIQNGEWMEMEYTLDNIQQAFYVRLRGANLPADVPYETDFQGNPLVDSEAGNILYDDPENPGTLIALDNDVEAWADLWFMSNPIFVGFDIEGDLNGNGGVDQDDVRIVMDHRGQPASACPECDIDGDWEIGAQDARAAVLLFTY
jgi:hypothetical protein